MVKLKMVLKYFLLLILILLAIIIYNSVYFDIPKENVIAKHAKGTSEFIELKDGSLIHVRDEGNKNGSTLVLIHGFNGSLFNFESMNKFLSDDFRIISLDLPAHGLTGPVNSDDYSIDGFIRVINEVLEIKNINSNQTNILNPEIRIYDNPRTLTYEAAIKTNLIKDYYLTMSNIDRSDYYNIKFQKKPLMAWIWISVIMIVVGGSIRLFSNAKNN